MATSKLTDAQQKNIIMDLFLDAYNQAIECGVDSDLLAEVLLYMGVTDLVASRGEEWTASTFSDLPERIESGEFSLPPEMVEEGALEFPWPGHA